MTNTVAPQPEPRLAGELRDTERLIALWHQKAAECGGPPSLSAFDFSGMYGGDCSYRFVVCVDAVAGDHTFLIYGPQFARLLELPEAPAFGAALARQIPARYLPVFIEGCGEAVAQGEPYRMSGAVFHGRKIDLYRAAFVPLAGRLQPYAQLVLGSFNRRMVLKVDALRRTYNWLGDEIRTDRSRHLT